MDNVTEVPGIDVSTSIDLFHVDVLIAFDDGELKGIGAGVSKGIGGAIGTETSVWSHTIAFNYQDIATMSGAISDFKADLKNFYGISPTDVTSFSVGKVENESDGRTYMTIEATVTFMYEGEEVTLVQDLGLEFTKTQVDGNENTTLYESTSVKKDGTW